MLELHKVFNVFDFCLDSNFSDMITNVTDALEKNCFNLKASSEDLFVHKNTLIIWIKNINNRLGMNYIHNSGDRDFMRQLNSYLVRSKINKN